MEKRDGGLIVVCKRREQGVPHRLLTGKRREGTVVVRRTSTTTDADLKRWL
jgi:hypothetical protein